jgi:lantibiotic modifying enzyme
VRFKGTINLATAFDKIVLLEHSMPSNETWSVLLDGDRAEQALQAINTIARDTAYPFESIWKWGWERDYPQSLGFGNAGIAIFFSYLAKAFGKSEYAETALLFLTEAELSLKEESLSLGFLTGVSGILWAVERVNSCLHGQAALPNPGMSEEPLLRWCRGGHDFHAGFMDGLSGICLYAAERMPRLAARSLLQVVMEKLEESADRIPPGIAWRISPNTERHLQAFVPGFSQGKDVYFIGVQEGLAGIVGGLLATYAMGEDQARTKQLIEKAILWMLSHRRISGTNFFPIAVGTELPPLATGWLSGDPGIVTVLFNAGLLLGREDWKRVALQIARVDAQKRLRYTRMRDSNYNLCDGLGGRAHLYNRLFQATGDQLFADAARHCFAQALDLRNPGEGTGGFLYNEIDFKGFLSGTAGLGLALLAAVSPVEPAWDRILLASFATRPKEPT